MAHGPDLHKERHWLGLIRRWQRSQLTAREFCERLGLSEPSFYAWRRTLKERGLWSPGSATRQPEKPEKPTPRFLPVQIAGSSGPSRCFELVFPDELVLRVSDEFDAGALRRLLAVLKERSC